MMTGNTLSYFLLWRIWIYLNTHPEWTSRADSLRIVSTLCCEFGMRLSLNERDTTYDLAHEIRTQEVL